MVSGPLEQDAHEVHPPPLPAGQAVDVIQQHLVAQPQAVGQPGHDRLGLVAPVLPELFLEVGEELDVLGGGVLGHLGAGLTQGVVEYVEAPSGKDVGETDGLEAQPALDRNLGEGAVGTPDGHLAGGPHVVPRLLDDHRDEGGLAGAVSADQGHLLAGADHKGGVAEQGPVTDLDGE